ncbi:hypothetical protein KKA53_04255 [Candidatus Dependentiae bacterium]|nr:hypothetical protein [Candidatus Dependentiae bacterium]
MNKKLLGLFFAVALTPAVHAMTTDAAPETKKAASFITKSLDSLKDAGVLVNDLLIGTEGNHTNRLLYTIPAATAVGIVAYLAYAGYGDYGKLLGVAKACVTGKDLRAAWETDKDLVICIYALASTGVVAGSNAARSFFRSGKPASAKENTTTNDSEKNLVGETESK